MENFGKIIYLQLIHPFSFASIIFVRPGASVDFVISNENGTDIFLRDYKINLRTGGQKYEAKTKGMNEL